MESSSASKNRWRSSRADTNVTSPKQDYDSDSSDDIDFSVTAQGKTLVKGHDGTSHLLMYSSQAAAAGSMDGSLLQAQVSNSELQQVIESQKREIKYLTEKVNRMEQEKQDMIDNFKLSSSVLLERLKDLEAQTSMIGERPQTANVLSKISADTSGKRIGQSNGNNARGRSKGPTQGKPQKNKVEEYKGGINNSVVYANSDDENQEELQPMLCPNCKQTIQPADIATHTVQCYRNSTKCKICGEIIQKDRKKDHITKFRDFKRLIEFIAKDNEDEVSLYFDHGAEVNMIFTEVDVQEQGWTPMHYAAKNGSLTVVLALVSRGAGVDPTDNNLKTPLCVAIENGKTAVARSLIELGADIESRDTVQRTPLMYACKAGSKEAVELLLQYKADIKAVNNLGDSCVNLAQKSGNSEVMMILVKNGASIRPASRSRPSIQTSASRKMSQLQLQ